MQRTYIFIFSSNAISRTIDKDRFVTYRRFLSFLFFFLSSFAPFFPLNILLTLNHLFFVPSPGTTPVVPFSQNILQHEYAYMYTRHATVLFTCTRVYVCVYEAELALFRDPSALHNLYEKRYNTCILPLYGTSILSAIRILYKRCRSNIGG